MMRINKLEASIKEKPEPLDLEKLTEKLDNWKWYNQAWWWIRHGIWNWITDLKWRIPNTIHRARYGWGHADVWGLDYYLTDVMRGALRHLKAHKHGTPMIIDTKTYDEKKWDEILDYMIATFDTAHRILEHEIIYIPTYEHTKEEWDKLYQEFLNTHDKRTPRHAKIGAFPMPMSRTACERYELGWEYFKRYFFSLWD